MAKLCPLKIASQSIPLLMLCFVHGGSDLEVDINRRSEHGQVEESHGATMMSEGSVLNAGLGKFTARRCNEDFLPKKSLMHKCIYMNIYFRIDVLKFRCVYRKY